MPKPSPETSDRYRIHCEVPLERVGYVLKGLTELGVTSVGHELITDIPVYKQRKPRQAAAPEVKVKKRRAKKRGGARKKKISNKDFILHTCFKDRDQFTAHDLNEMFEKDGRNVKSAGSMLTHLHNGGYVKSMGDGVWKILAKGRRMNGAMEKANG